MCLSLDAWKYTTDAMLVVYSEHRRFAFYIDINIDNKTVSWTKGLYYE